MVRLYEIYRVNPINLFTHYIAVFIASMTTLKGNDLLATAL
jgi:hypothetical protein